MNSRLGESVSDLYREKIRLGEFKAVYIIWYFSWLADNNWKFSLDGSDFYYKCTREDMISTIYKNFTDDFILVTYGLRLKVKVTFGLLYKVLHNFSESLNRGSMQFHVMHLVWKVSVIILFNKVTKSKYQ